MGNKFVQGSRVRTALLYNLTEFFDRFVYYGIQTLLILFLIKQFTLTTAAGLGYFSFYVSVGFCLPIVTGYLTDKLYNPLNATIMGLAFLILGQLLMSFHQLHYFQFGLSLLLCGIALIKPNVASLVSQLVTKTDLKRENTIVTYYLFMNAGAILGPIVLGALALFSYEMAFIFSAIICFIFLLVLIFHLFNTFVVSFSKEIIAKNKVLFYLSIISILVLLTLFIHFAILYTVMFSLLVVTVLSLLVRSSLYSPYRHQVIFLLMLMISAVVFFMAQIQITSSLLLFIKNNHIFQFSSVSLPPQWFTILEPLSVILLSPLNTLLLKRFDHNKQHKVALVKVMLGLVMALLSFLIFYGAISCVHFSVTICLLLLILGSLLLGWGELLLGPTVTSIAGCTGHSDQTASYMGLWFFAIGIAGFLGSKLTKYAYQSTRHNLIATQQLYAVIMLITGLMVVALLIYAFFMRSKLGSVDNSYFALQIE